MSYERIVISSGHGKYVRGASGILDEVDEARRVVDQIGRELTSHGVDVVIFHDNTSHDQNTNLHTITNFHNSKSRDLDISVHFNAYVETSKPMGVEVLYVTQSSLAAEISGVIAANGFINRGAKKRTDLFFLNNTEKPAILIETCFVDSSADADIYGRKFSAICDGIARVLGGPEAGVEPEPPEAGFMATGRISSFGGPEDTGVSEGEGLAFYTDLMQAPHLFLPYQPDGTTGLARRLNPHIHYLACRWDYAVTPKAMLREHKALVRSTKTGVELTAFPADWGPHENTDRVADLSPGLMDDLGLKTDDEVQVVFPYTED
jgi:N-acetylmuramoyl-L-alanine amidase